MVRDLLTYRLWMLLFSASWWLIWEGLGRAGLGRAGLGCMLEEGWGEMLLGSLGLILVTMGSVADAMVIVLQCLLWACS